MIINYCIYQVIVMLAFPHYVEFDKQININKF